MEFCPVCIDLGLAKAVNEPSSQTPISIPGWFAGTPEFASPEQFAGVGVDIRSDLYSLGAMLWKTVTGDALFMGSPAEVMYQHQHAPLPLEKLKGLPQPVAALLDTLLEKDPARRFQNPVELLNALPAITGTTRLPVADIAEHESTSALRRDLDQLSSDAGAKLLRALGVKGEEAELRSASDEFSGHCLALTLLGSYLADAYHGDIRHRHEVSTRLAQDVRQGVHARKVMESYETWFGEGPELSVLRILGLFDRPTHEKTLGILLEPPAIRGITESLTDLSSTEWRTILAKLRRARLLAGEDPHHRGYLDTHPLVREYFGEQLRSQRTQAWKDCNRRLYYHYRTLAPQLPDSFREMEPLFLALICGCNAGLFRQALHEVYIPRIQRSNASFAANVLGARGALLSVLAHFFEQGRWGSPLKLGIAGQSLTAADQLFIFTQAGLYLTATRGLAAPEARICSERAEPLCHSLNRPVLLYSALMGQWRYSLMTDKLSAAMRIAKRVHSLAREQNDSTLNPSFCAAIRIANEQKSTSLAKRAEAASAEYRCQKGER